MFDQTPIRERTAAVGVFTAIFLSGLGACYLLVTGGFAFSYDESAEAAPAPAYVRVVDSGWAPPAPARITPTSFAIGEAYAADYPMDDLEGASGAPARERSAERSYEDIERDINALYEQTAEYRQDDYGDAVYADDTPSEDDFVYAGEESDAAVAKDEAFSDDGSGSPS